MIKHKEDYNEDSLYQYSAASIQDKYRNDADDNNDAMLIKTIMHVHCYGSRDGDDEVGDNDDDEDDDDDEDEHDDGDKNDITNLVHSITDV